ncbi:GNAT family N-acetyltransferase [Rhodoligotrophos defluvii]|uniref:GNAT family N-acetyltransferase n=1 Tax=Rhodoligotrophos defluvii TaxID=2561934 RepID=UPI0010C9A0C5|nr:N-acetyltransferase [Rhodoligotrophos defluvii]
MNALTPIILKPFGPSDHAAVEALLDRAFGLGRQAKTSYRLREGEKPIDELCRVAWFAGEIVGSIWYSPVKIGPAGTDALLLGPLAVSPDLQNCGIGMKLMQSTLADAAALGHRLVILVGDAPYYARVGFSKVPEGRLTLPGPVDPNRLLYRELVQHAFDGVSGLVLGPNRWRAVREPSALAVPAQGGQVHADGFSHVET